MGPLNGPKNLFLGPGADPGSQNPFFHFYLNKWGKSYNLMCHNRYVWWLCEMGPLNGPKYPFLGPGGDPGSQNPFFSILIFISEANPLIWYVTVSMFHNFELLNPPMGPLKPLFGPWSGPMTPKPIFFALTLMRESNPLIWYVTR